MFQQQTIQLHNPQGVWIDTQWLRDAGLGKNIRVTIEQGEIRLTDIRKDLVELASPITQETRDAGWKVFQTLGDDAVPGKLTDTSINHDLYLSAQYPLIGMFEGPEILSQDTEEILKNEIVEGSGFTWKE